MIQPLFVAARIAPSPLSAQSSRVRGPTDQLCRRAQARRRWAVPLRMGSALPEPQSTRREGALQRVRWGSEAQHIAAQARGQLARFGITTASLERLLQVTEERATPEVGARVRHAQEQLRSLEAQVLAGLQRTLGQRLGLGAVAAAGEAALDAAYDADVAAADGQLLDWLTALQSLCVRCEEGAVVAPLSEAQQAEVRMLHDLVRRSRGIESPLATLLADCSAAPAPHAQVNVACLALQEALELAAQHLPESSLRALQRFYWAPAPAPNVRGVREPMLARGQQAAEAVAEDIVRSLEGLHEALEMADGALEALVSHAAHCDSGGTVVWPFAP